MIVIVCTISAVLDIMAIAWQYFSSASCTARSTSFSWTLLPVSGTGSAAGGAGAIGGGQHGAELFEFVGLLGGGGGYEKKRSQAKE